jgi:hypothetical protein
MHMSSSQAVHDARHIQVHSHPTPGPSGGRNNQEGKRGEAIGPGAIGSGNTRRRRRTQRPYISSIGTLYTSSRDSPVDCRLGTSPLVAHWPVATATSSTHHNLQSGVTPSQGGNRRDRQQTVGLRVSGGGIAVGGSTHGGGARLQGTTSESELTHESNCPGRGGQTYSKGTRASSSMRPNDQSLA